jgi:hypothetical protein
MRCTMLIAIKGLTKYRLTKNTCVGWRYSGNQINTVVFMICLKKELLRAYASSSSISVLCVITL